MHVRGIHVVVALVIGACPSRQTPAACRPRKLSLRPQKPVRDALRQWLRFAMSASVAVDRWWCLTITHETAAGTNRRRVSASATTSIHCPMTAAVSCCGTRSDTAATVSQSGSLVRLLSGSLLDHTIYCFLICLRRTLVWLGSIRAHCCCLTLPWHIGDVLGVFLDIDRRRVNFATNGETLAWLSRLSISHVCAVIL